MSPETSSRRWTSRTGIAMGALFLISVADTLIGAHLDGSHTVRALAGSRQTISGDLNQPVRRPADVHIDLDRPGLKVEVIQVKGRRWRGELTVPSAVPEGIYHLKAAGGATAEPAAVPALRIMVFRSTAAMNASHPSLSRRLAGIPPWWIGAGAAPLLAACLLLSFRQAGERYRLLDQEGLAPIVKLARHKDHWEIAAILAPGHGLREGTVLEVVDKHLRSVAGMTVARIEGGLAFGQVDLTALVRPDGFVRVSPADQRD